MGKAGETSSSSSPPAEFAPPPATSLGRQLRGRLLALLRGLPAAVLTFALIGYILRDREPIFALLMYVPLLPVAVTVLAWDLVLRGRSLPRGRYVASLLAALAGIWGTAGMIGSGATSSPSTTSWIRMVQWNVQWGGPGGDATWRTTSDAIVAEKPDLVVLNEAPQNSRIEAMCARLGDGWNFVTHANRPGNPYWFRLALASRWPAKLEAIFTLPNGTAIGVTVATPRGPLRVLIVDGISKPMVLRTPLLHAVAQTCRDARSAGVPFDLVSGDFNALSRSIGFDELREMGFVLASSKARGWRGTFPSSLPLYDIDHVWVAPRGDAAGAGLTPTACQLFSSSSTNHRGQSVILATN